MTDPVPSVHSREGYARLARELAGYAHPWRRELRGPDPELTFDLLLSSLLTPETRVLEAGCGHGPDARRFGPLAASWTAYDFIPEFLKRARREAPHAHFHEWNGRGAVPAGLRGPFDLIVSRRGPTSVILRLPTAEVALTAEDPRTLAFLRGETLPVDRSLSGYALVTVDSFPLGWGKASRGTLKNHLPKGLRRLG